MSSSENPEEHRYSHHGYFVKEHKGAVKNPYVFCSDRNNIPTFFHDEEKNISKCGSIVAVLGFTSFGKNKIEDVRNEIIKAVLINFAIAIYSNKLSIEIKDYDGSNLIIDDLSIQNYFDKIINGVNSKKESRQLRQTQETIQTYQTPDNNDKLQQYPDCEIFLRNNATEHDVSIWRNGMLITRKLSKFTKNDFDGKKIFKCSCSSFW